MSDKIQKLLEQANFSNARDSSVNQAKRTFLSRAEAEEFFNLKRGKLLDLGNWDEKSTPSNYGLFDESGSVSASKIITIGKFIRINVYGSGKYDWVKVIDVYDAPDELVITVEPTYDPTGEPQDKSVTSHFFKSEAINNFCLQKDDTSIALYVIGLNEKANVEESGNPAEAARNVAAANLGYYLGLQKAMWTEFCKNFLEVKEEN